MSSPKRKRDVAILFWVSADEMELIQQKMQQWDKEFERLSAENGCGRLCGAAGTAGTERAGILLRRSSNNKRQLTRKVHETGRVYDVDLEDISQRQEQLWDGVKENPDPTLQTFVTGTNTPFAEKEERRFFAAPSSAFSFCLYPCLLAVRQG